MMLILKIMYINVNIKNYVYQKLIDKIFDIIILYYKYLII
jgi:hypothetical protein